MKLTGFGLFALLRFLSSVVAPAAGKPLRSDSPVRVVVAVGGDVTLPCLLAESVDTSRVWALEWSRVEGVTSWAVHVLRQGKELAKEMAPEYVERTAVTQNGSLRLFGVQRKDGGTYECVCVRGESRKESASVSLIVAQVSQVNFDVRRTSANELFLFCSSVGWSPDPLLSLLDSHGNNISARRTADSISALLDAKQLTALTGNGTLICRVEIPETDLVNENRISITDEIDRDPPAGCFHWVLVSVAMASLCVAAAVVFCVPVKVVEMLRRSPRRLIGFCSALMTAKRDGGQDQLLPGGDRFTEYGDVGQLETTGASVATATANQLLSTGVEASNQLAEKDLKEMLNYQEMIYSVGESVGVAPSLIAAIVSRQSQAGTKLSADGFGATDRNCFGLMQINKHYHAVKGNPFGRDHVDQGVTFLIQLVKTMRRKEPSWSKEQQLKGALACYIAGEEKVLHLPYEALDGVTPNGDFASDVVARAHWFARHGFGASRRPEL